MTYDVIYSLCFHQQIDYVNHYLKNLEKYNINNKYLVIINLSNDLSKVRDKIYDRNVIIYYKSSNKRRITYDLMNAYIDNYIYLKLLNLKFNNYMLLTSSSRFVKQISKLEEYKGDIGIFEGGNLCHLKSNWPHTNNFFKNKKIINIFKENKIDICYNEVVGTIYPEKVFGKIVDFITSNNFKIKIESETVFEEIILPSLYKYFTNKNLDNSHAYTFRRNRDGFIIPNEKQIISKLNENPKISIIKRFPEDLNDVAYYYLDNGHFNIYESYTEKSYKYNYQNIKLFILFAILIISIFYKKFNFFMK